MTPDPYTGFITLMYYLEPEMHQATVEVVEAPDLQVPG